MKGKTAIKFKIACMFVALFLTLATVIAIASILEFANLSTAWMTFLVILMFVVLFLGCAACVILERKALEYECSKCGNCFIPTIGGYLAGPHTLRRRKLKCPKCGISNWCKLRIKKIAEENNEKEKEKTQE